VAFTRLSSPGPIGQRGPASRIDVATLLGIGIERIRPGHPQQNGRHERMDLTLKNETTKPAGLNSLQQQARVDDFIDVFNNERPHEGHGH
jgi:transposase InsO family protein